MLAAPPAVESPRAAEPVAFSGATAVSCLVYSLA